MTNNFNGGDSYAAPPLDSYEPGKYSPSFLKPRPQQQQQPSLPPKVYLPQRPPASLAPRPIPAPQYVPTIPQKLFRPQGPPPNFRPQQNSHAQSIAQGYSSGQSQSQSLHAPGPIRQQPRYPLPHRAPVPQGLFQSIGQHVQALDNGQRGNNIGDTYLPPPTNLLPLPPMKLIVPNLTPAQPFHAQQQSHSSGSSASSSSGYSYQNQELRNVHVIHDCGKGPQLNQGYAGQAQNYQAPFQGYGTPLGQPLESYQSSVASQGQSLSSNYEVPSVSLAVPHHNSIDFNSPSNSYGPPASGPASLDVIGLESQQRANTVLAEHQNIISAGTTSQVFEQALPGLSSGLSGSGLNFLSAQKSHSIEVPSQGGNSGSYQLQFVQSHSGQNSNSIDSQNHDNILADGLLSSIISAIEKKPAQTVPQVTEDQETDHSEVQVFLKSPEGQDVLADKPVSDVDQSEHEAS